MPESLPGRLTVRAQATDRKGQNTSGDNAFKMTGQASALGTQSESETKIRPGHEGAVNTVLRM